MSKSTIHRLGTEQRNRAARDLDTKSALEIARILNREDAKVAAAVRKALPQIGKAIEAAAAAIQGGGRLIYAGAGTSGRIAALDAAECPPTFNTDPKSVQYVMAGGEKALGRAAEANEDSREQGAADIARLRPSRKDVVIGLAASGRTPYTIGAVEYAKQRGAQTAAIVCNRGSELGKLAGIEIVADVGPEAVSGSTRMKAATAQKMICNMITTGAMTRLGYVFGNLMVNVHPKNEKLRERAVGILMEAAGVDRRRAHSALTAADNSVPVALVSLMAGLSPAEARRRLEDCRGNVRQAIGI